MSFYKSDQDIINMTDDELLAEIRRGEELLPRLVGPLYSSIVEDKLDALRKERQRREAATPIEVWKFELPAPGVRDVPMPAGAELLSVGLQGGDIVLWARVDPRRDKLPRRVRVVATGEAFAGHWRFIGTVQMNVTEPTPTHMNTYQMVYHVFEEETL